MPDMTSGLSRRSLLSLMGAIGGSAFVYDAMTTMGYAETSPYKGPIDLQGGAKGKSVVIIGAGLAGLTAAMELTKAGYKVQILEYNSRIGGRQWTIRGGDSWTELGGETQTCAFDKGVYMNPGPWRISHHHKAIFDYARRLNIPMEPFIEKNYSTFVHSTNLFGGKPQRYHNVVKDFQGHIAELLAKSSQQTKLDGLATQEDGEMFRQILRMWAGLDKDLKYVKGADSSKMRGFDSSDFSTGTRTPSDPMSLTDVLKISTESNLWTMSNHDGVRDLQNPMFQPVGGMDRITHAMAERVPGIVRMNAKVTAIQQDDTGVTVVYEDVGTPGVRMEAKADYCICTVPLTIMGQMDLQVGPKMKAAVDSMAYFSSVKVGLQFKRRFWEQDESIFGGLSHTNLPIRSIGYPSGDLNGPGKGMLYGAFNFGIYALEFSSMPVAERIRKTVEYGMQIHPQYKDEFENGVSVAWHRMPFSLGCGASWNEQKRKDHFAGVYDFDGRIVCAGEAVAAAVGGWQEGAILSALDVVGRIHQRVHA